jgi:hypothetical protein
MNPTFASINPDLPATGAGGTATSLQKAKQTKTTKTI